MQDDAIFVLTPLGERELRSGVTSLSPTEIELMVRLDGVLSLGQLKATMPQISAESLEVAIRSLLNRQLLALLDDPFTDKFQFKLDDQALKIARPEAETGDLSLKKAGYYVSIARKRDADRSQIPAGKALTAVVVDDEPLLAKVIETLLKLDGFTVRLAGKREEIIAQIRKLPVPDLILLDVMLPDADGFDILLRLRQHPALKTVPVIMLTGKSTREDVLKGLAGGADGYITKPFEATVLLRAVHTVLGLPDDTGGPGKARDPWAGVAQ